MASYQFIIDSGTVNVDTESLLSDVQTEFRNALGPNINLAASTPQGTLVAGEAVARAFVMKNNSDLANTINPEISYGVFLDAICAFMGIKRGEDESTTGQGTYFVGLENTFIPAGSRLKTSNGDVFSTAGDINIPSAGVITGDIICAESGPVALPFGDLTILDGAVGWASATVSNGTPVPPSISTVPTTIIIGSTALNDTQLKISRRQRLGQLGVGSSAALLAEIDEVPNVSSVHVVENNTGSTGLVNGVTFSLDSAMWVCVDGGTDADIAAAAYRAHTGGTPWDFGTAGQGTPVNAPNGITVLDPKSKLPYQVKFCRPNYYDVYCHIIVKQNTTISSPTESVQKAIVNYCSGNEENEPGLVISANVSSFEYSGAVSRQVPGMYVKMCRIAVVPAGSPAPAYPADYADEFLMPAFGRGKQAVSNIVVELA